LAGIGRIKLRWHGQRLFGLSLGLTFLLQLAERAIGAFMHAMEAGFVAGQEGEGMGLVGQGTEGEREVGGGVGLGRILQLGLLLDDFAVEQGGFDGPEPQDAPAGNDHFIDQDFFGGSGRIVRGEIFCADFLEQVRIFALEQDCVVGRETVTGGIERRFLPRGSGLRAAGFGSVGSGGFGSQG